MADPKPHLKRMQALAMNFDYPPGATPLDPDEAAGLIPSHISTHAQINEWEMANIIAGNLIEQSDLRQRCLDALRAADAKNLAPLLAFVRP